MAMTQSTARVPGTGRFEIPLDACAVGPILAPTQHHRDFEVTVETDQHGDTRAYVELARAA